MQYISYIDINKYDHICSQYWLNERGNPAHTQLGGKW